MAVVALLTALVAGACSGGTTAAAAANSPARSGRATSPAATGTPTATTATTAATPTTASPGSTAAVVPTTAPEPAPPTTNTTPKTSAHLPLAQGIPRNGQTVAGTTATVSHLTLDQRTRTWITYTGPGGGTGRPLLVFIHGTDATVDQEASRDRLLPLVAAGELSLVYPVGFEENWDAGGGCCGVAASAGLHDADFVRQVTAAAITRLAPDPGRIYLSGYSAGGKLAWALVCGKSGQFAAVATFGASPTVSCPPTGVRLPVLMGFGAADRAEPLIGKKPDSRGPHPAAVVNRDTWRTRDGCPTASTTVHGATTVRRTWTCDTDTSVSYVLWPHGRHLWPSPPGTSVAESAGLVMWTFLAAQRAPSLLTAAPTSTATATATTNGDTS